MRLSVNEYFSFNLKSRKSLLKSKGQMLLQRSIDTETTAQLYKIYGFYVEAYSSNSEQSIVKISPVYNEQILDFYLEGIDLDDILN